MSNDSHGDIVPVNENVSQKAFRLIDVSEELIAQGLDSFDAVKHGVRFVAQRYPEFRVVELSDSEIVISSEKQYEFHVKFNSEKVAIATYFLTPEMILTSKDLPEEIWYLDGLKGTRTVLSRYQERGIERIIYGWFVQLSDYDEIGWPIDGLSSRDLTNRKAS